MEQTGSEEGTQLNKVDRGNGRLVTSSFRVYGGWFVHTRHSQHIIMDRHPTEETTGETEAQSNTKVRTSRRCVTGLTPGKV